MCSIILNKDLTTMRTHYGGNFAANNTVTNSANKANVNPTAGCDPNNANA